MSVIGLPSSTYGNTFYYFIPTKCCKLLYVCTFFASMNCFLADDGAPVAEAMPCQPLTDTVMPRLCTLLNKRNLE